MKHKCSFMIQPLVLCRIKSQRMIRFYCRSVSYSELICPYQISVAYVMRLIVALILLLFPSQTYGLIPGLQIERQQDNGQLYIGVLDLTPHNIDERDGMSISARMRMFLAQHDVFKVMERDRMNEIMEELNFQQSGACSSNECVIQVGKMIGVRKMIAGEVFVVESRYSLQIRLVDVATGSVEHQAYRDVNSIEQILEVATKEVADELAQLVAGAARVVFQSNLSGVILQISGGRDYRTVLRNMEESFLLNPGQYQIKLSAPGYRSTMYDIDLAWNSTLTQQVHLHPKSRVLAGCLSLLVPGLGQSYEGRPNTAAVMFLTATATSILTLISSNDYSELKSEYYNLQQEFCSVTTDEELQTIRTSLANKHRELRSERDNLDLLIKLLGGMWIANIFDSILNMPRLHIIQHDANAIRSLSLLSRPYTGLALRFTIHD